MADRFSITQRQVVDRDNRNMAAAGYPMGDELNEIWAAIDTGNIGITADAGDVDSLAKGGGLFSWDGNTASLDFGYGAGRLAFAGSVVEVAAGTIALSASAVNYIEVSAAGTVYKNTSGWTAGRIRLYKVTTGSGDIATVENQKVLSSLLQPASVTGALLSTAPATKSIEIYLGDVSATVVAPILLPNVGGTITRVAIASKTSISTSDTDYWTYGVVNKGAAGTGTTVAVDGSVAANSTKATGGSAQTNYVKRSLTLTGTSGDLVTAAEDVLAITITKTGSATTMTGVVVRVDLLITD